MNNLYWAIYKNLEKEVASLADLIHFDDKQLSVYSVRIADLIIRCAVEIEALAKELYECNGGNMSPLDANGSVRSLYFDTDCLDFLEGQWALGEKQVIITNTNVYFESENNRILTPLKKANIRGKCEWKTTYQAVKHDRGKNLDKANIKNLLRALAALFILNIYFRNERFVLDRYQKLSDNSLGSSIFSVKTEICSAKFPDSEVMLNEDELKAVYLIKPTDTWYAKYFKEAESTFRKQRDAIIAAGYTPQKNEDDEEEDITHDDIFRIAATVGGADLISRISTLEQSVIKTYNTKEYEAVLNRAKSLSFSTEESGGN